MKYFERFLSIHQKRIVGLDILRSFAILVVMYEHGKFLLPEEMRASYLQFNPLKVDGVSIFFVLSGFLIGGILFKIIRTTDFTRFDLLNFWIRRWFRTIPNYLIVLLGVLVYRMIIFKDLADFSWRYFVFMQNLWTPHPSFFPEAWSLTTEEWFYLLFPALCFLFHKMLKNKSKSILVSALVFLIIPMLLRIVKYELGFGVDDFDSEFRKITILRLDSIMYGVIAAYVYLKKPELWLKYKNFLLGFGLLCIGLLNSNVIHWNNFYRPLFFNVESVITLCFLPFLSTYKTTRFKVLDALFVFVSILSYSMYLLNLTPVQRHVIPILNGLLGWEDHTLTYVYLSNTLMYWVFTVGFSFVLYRYYENPITNLRNRVRVK